MKSTLIQYFKKTHIILVAIILVGFLLRLSFFMAAKPWDPIIEKEKIIVSDAITYHEYAVNIVQNKIIASPDEFYDAFRTPGYPLFIASVYSVFGVKPWVVLLFQIVLNILGLLLVFMLGNIIFKSSKISLIATFMCAIDPHMIMYCSYLLADILFTVVFLASITSFVYWLKERKLWYVLFAGLFLGIAVLVRPIAQYFIFVYIIIMLLDRKIMFRIKSKAIICITVAFFFIISFWMVRNYHDYGVFAVSHITGYNLHFNTIYTEVARTGKTYEEVSDEFYKRAQDRGIEKIENPMMQSQIYKELAVEYIHKYPWTYFKRHCVGIVNMFANLTASQTCDMLGIKKTEKKYDFCSFNNYFEMIRWFFANKNIYEIGIGLVIALYLFFVYLFAVVGSLKMIRKDFFSWAVLMAIIVYFSLCTGVIGVSRYKIPIIPFYVLISAYGLVNFSEWMKNMKVRVPPHKQ
ncbi:MAG: glycosyltransferase family 39 protein [Endomicrobiales bacterium]|nr:glycosyltransferase family 39 protein [Endomicrobiales bacterium]